MGKRAAIHYHIMLLPAMILLALFSLYPMLGAVIAFQNFDPMLGMWGSEFVGLENFRFMFSIPDVKQIFYNTLFIAIFKILVTQSIAIMFALMLNEVRQIFFKKFVQTVVYLPHFISWVLLGGILMNLLSLDGIVNNFLSSLGMQPILFLGSDQWFRKIIIGSHAWQEFGFTAIVYLAALTSINPELYEAADVDGAGRISKLLAVTLPALVPTIILMLTLDMQNILNAGFEQILNLYNPLVYKTGDIIDTYVFRAGLHDFQYELATAVGLLKSLVSLFMVGVSYFLASKFANYRIF